MADDGVRKELPPAESSTGLPKDDNNRIRHPAPAWNSLATAAFALGVCSLINLYICAAGFFGNAKARDVIPFLLLEMGLGPATLVVGILGLRYARRRSGGAGRGYAIFAVVVGGLACLFFLGLLLLWIWLILNPQHW
ncbi:MAG TPA: hypothetical protein DDY78_11890 [Planctomycetales bacterium]|jgi:hypothetical protein|nr:hypothetical protein [Planctomycetales bacterium]